MLPAETVEALAPSGVEKGRFKFCAMSLLHAAVLEAMGVDFGGSLDRRQLIVAGYVLTVKPRELQERMRDSAWMASLRDGAHGWACELAPGDMVDLAKGVYAVVEKAYSTLVPPEGGAENPPDGQPASVGR